MPLDPGGKGGEVNDLLVIVDQGDAAHPHRGQLMGHPACSQAAIVALATRHRHRVIEQDLVGHVDVGRDRGPDRHDARMVVGSVTDVLEHMVP